MNKFYVYLHIKLDTGEPFYVGKGSGTRAYSKRNRSIWWKRILNKHGFDVILLEEDLTEDQAFDREIYWIKRIGRKDLKQGSLVNMTDGGEGKSGHIISDETKEKCRLINLKYITPEEKREALRLNSENWRKRKTPEELEALKIKNNLARRKTK